MSLYDLPGDLQNFLLAVMRDDLKKVAAADTAYDAATWLERRGLCPLTGHCYAVALLVQSRYGGSIMRGKATYNGRPESHYWNKVDGVEIDLTGSQYGGDGWHPVASGEAVEPHIPNPNGKARMEKLASRLPKRDWMES